MLKRKEEMAQPATQAAEGRYTKEQFLKSRQRSGREKDVLSVVLEQNKTYTIAEAETAMQAFVKMEAK